MRGLIIATDRAAGFNDGRLCALVRIGGISLLERHARVLRKNAVKDILVLTTQRSEEIQAEIDHLTHLKLNLRQVWCRTDASIELNGTFAENDDQPWLLIDGSMIFDERLPQLLVKGDKTQVVLDSAAEVDEEHRGLLIDMQAFGANNGEVFAGCALLQAGALNKIRVADGKAWLAGFLGAEVQSGGGFIRIADLADYSYDMRRHLKYVWMPIASPADNSRAKKMLLDWGQKRVLDWPAWFIHQPVEKAIVYRLCEYPVTPNQLTLLNNVVAFIAMGFFAIGWLIPGLLLALCVGVLDGLDGKQARIKQMTSEWGRLEELLDKIYENGWYLALAYYFSNVSSGSALPYALFWIIFSINMLEIALGLIFRFTRHVQLDDIGPFERRFRLVAGRRNTYMWTLLPFFAAAWLCEMPELYYFGFVSIVVYALLSIGVHAWRAVCHIANKTVQRTP